MSRDARLARYGEVSTELALLSDRRLAHLVDGAQALGHGIGGTSALLEVAGAPVFVKRVPLTDLERHPDHVRSTANLFDLPPRCQYGVGGHAGFGVWRELAANTWTTNWVLTGRTEAFPLLYHWRVLPGAPPLNEELRDVEGAVAYWGGAEAVRERIHAVAAASASVVLFLEHVPHGLADWLAGNVEAAGAVEERLRADVGFLNANGLLHFDTHFGNLRTDGQRLYLVDFGLATSPRFELSAAESRFVAHNAGHDVAYALTCLVNWLVSNVCGVSDPGTAPVDRNAYIRRCAAGAVVDGVPAGVAAVIERHAPLAAVVNDFYWDLFGVSRATPYPAAKIAAARTFTEVAASVAW